ncbi:YEATS domain-containing protein 2 [Mortierella claussenii]|nr:YEATS domain-containing protein 2 [Mortierella claussenii]
MSSAMEESVVTSVFSDSTSSQPAPQQMPSVNTKAETTRRKIIDIIDHQFDLEMLLRHAERAAISQELTKAERMLEDLRHAILSERQGSPYGNSTASRTSVTAPNQGVRQSSRRAAAYYGRDVRQPEALYAVRADGQFVRLGCPKCDRYDFGSTQGLINHMRLSHKLVFKNTEEGVRYCGVVVPSSEVPADHPCRSKIVFSSLGASDGQGQGDLPKPTIKTYDEDVDLEMDDGRARDNSRGPAPQLQRKGSVASVNSSSNAGTESESDTSGMVSGGESGLGAGKRRRSSLALSLVRPQKGTAGAKANAGPDSDGSEDSDDSSSEMSRPPHAGKGPMRKYGSISQGPPPHSDLARPNMPSRLAVSTSFSVPDSRMSSAVSSRAASPTIHPFEHHISEPSTPVAGFPTPSIPSAVTYNINSSAATPSATSAPSTPHAGLPKVLQPTIITFGASAVHAGVPAPLDTVGSRFYVKRRIVVGNVSKYLPEDKRDPRLREFPYKWMIYVDGTPKPEDITAYVSKVEFHLHESYKPNHIVTVSEPPFHLSRYAWGETQIKVRLFFHDVRNKPVEVYHRLALDPTHCGRQVHGRERHVDLELDRNTTFIETTPFQSRSRSGTNKSGSRNNLILNSAAEVAMADGADEDERELQNTLSHPSVPSSTHARDVNNAGVALNGSDSSTTTSITTTAITTTAAAAASTAVDTVRAASIDEGVITRHNAKETTLSYCKACGSLWKQHRDGALGVAGIMSEPVLLNEDTGHRIPSCPHHPGFYAVKEVSEEERMLLSLLMGRSKNKFALDMLKNCGIVDQHGRPVPSHDRTMELQQLQQADSAMELDVGDSELPVVPSMPSPAPLHPTSALSVEQQARMAQLTDAFQKMEVYKCRRSEIDWVLSVMDELKLKTLFLDGGAGGGSGGSRSGLRERDQEQEQLLNTPGLTSVPESMSQRAVVGGLLVQITKAFLGRILSKAVDIHRAESEAEKGPESIMMELDTLHESEAEEDGKAERNGGQAKENKVSEKLLAPYHIYQALQSNPEELDFLTSQHEDMEGIGEMMVGL